MTTPELTTGSEPGSSGRSALRRLESQFLRPYRLAMALGLLGLIAQSLLMLPIPLLQGWVLDGLVPLVGTGGPIAGDASRQAQVSIALAFGTTAVCLIARTFLAWRVGTTMGRISQEVVVALRSTLQRKFMRLPMAYFDGQQTGRLMARVTSDVASILSFLNSGFLQLVTDLILALGIAVVLVWLRWQLALIALVVVPLYVVNHSLFARRIHQLSLEIRAQISALYALLSERVSAVRVVRSFAREDAELAALDERIDTHRALSWANTCTNATLGTLATLISGLGTVAVITAGAVLVRRGTMSVGELLAFYALIGQLYGPIVRLTQFQMTAVATLVSVERLFEVFDEPETIQERPDARPVPTGGALVFDDVRFRYGPDGPWIVDGIDLRIEPGRTVGILGPSGAGKSTLLALAPRLYDLEPGAGSITLGGIALRDLRLEQLRSRVALVPQQALLFEGTIRSNLLYATPDATPERIERALAIADLSALIASLPLGLQTPVGERGLSLSGGQRQRLALARALIAEPAILLLDDCTSALDTETEARIQAGLAAALPESAVVVVSHKVSSVWHADEILVLDGGRVLERGRHDELRALGGHYAATFEAQTHALALV